jgi:tRNA dimethylallyltransferase
MSERRERIVVIVGPTAGGKSDLAVSIAQHFAGEILSADSMQIYRHLNAGTAKPTPQQRAAIPHHLIEIVEPTERFTVADWLTRAQELIADLHARRILPIVVGGTNLYIKALLEGMFEGPPADESFRQSLDQVTTDELHDRLRDVDPAATERIDRQDRKRIVRALEVHHATGTPISAQQTQWSTPTGVYRFDPVMVGLRWSVDAINRRINLRVRDMFHPPDGSENLISETRRLEAAGLLGPQARQAIGTRQVLEHLAGLCSADQAMERVKIETRRFAKIQRTWLKRYRGVHWLDAEGLSPAELSSEAIEVARQAFGD